MQNIHFGLSPSLTSALQSIPRWRLVQAALPHVMHCAAALLTNRVKDLQNLGAAETKLLYTLHWILLFAAEECADGDDVKKEMMNPYDYLFSIPTISVKAITSKSLFSLIFHCFFKAIRLPFCSDSTSLEGIRFSKL